MMDESHLNQHELEMKFQVHPLDVRESFWFGCQVELYRFILTSLAIQYILQYMPYIMICIMIYFARTVIYFMF